MYSGYYVDTNYSSQKILIPVVIPHKFHYMASMIYSRVKGKIIYLCHGSNRCQKITLSGIIDLYGFKVS